MKWKTWHFSAKLFVRIQVDHCIAIHRHREYFWKHKRKKNFELKDTNTTEIVKNGHQRLRSKYIFAGAWMGTDGCNPTDRFRQKLARKAQNCLVFQSISQENLPEKSKLGHPCYSAESPKRELLIDHKSATQEKIQTQPMTQNKSQEPNAKIQPWIVADSPYWEIWKEQCNRHSSSQTILKKKQKKPFWLSRCKSK